MEVELSRMRAQWMIWNMMILCLSSLATKANGNLLLEIVPCQNPSLNHI